MKAMRIILVLTYIILVILLLLGLLFNTCRSCRMPSLPETTTLLPPDEPPVEHEVIDEAQGVGQDGQLKITLLWDFYADVDLHVKEPGGTEIYFNHKHSTSGGFLDVDNTDGGQGSAENVFWENPPIGNYEVSLVYYKKGSQTPTGGNCKVVVFNKDQQPQVFTVPLSEAQHRSRVESVPVTTVRFN